MASIKNIIKQLFHYLPFSVTLNQHYDRQTRRILKKHLNEQSNCVDIGCHKGEFLEYFLKLSPKGQHYAFEPIPELYRELKTKFSAHPNVHIYPVALSDQKKRSTFNLVLSNPAYSGLIKRRYDRHNEEDTTIEVETNELDQILPPAVPVHFIKIDVEGGELPVLKGASRTLHSYHPLIVFECGLGGSDFYGTGPSDIYQFFDDHRYQIFLLDDFLAGRSHLDLAAFSWQFNNNKNYYFIAQAQEA